MPLLTSDPVPTLTATQKAALIGRLARGASFAAACSALGLSVTAAFDAMGADTSFRRQVHQAELLLRQNVAAALYQQAMKGNVPAQTFLLKTRPPAEWNDDGPEFPVIPEDLTELTDAELDALIRAYAEALQRTSAP